MEITKKDKKYLIASAVLVLIAGISIAVFAAQEVYKSKNGIGKTSAKSDQAILDESDDVEVLEMERLNSFGRDSKQQEEIVVVSNKNSAEQAVREMDEIIFSIENEYLDDTKTE